MPIESDPMQPGASSQKIRLGILVSHPIQYSRRVYRKPGNAHDIDHASLNVVECN